MYKKGAKYNGYGTVLWIIGSLTVAFGIVFVCRSTAPVICELAAASLQSELNKICNRAVLDYLENENAEDIVVIDRGNGGEIRGIRTDTAKVNIIKSKISLDVQEKLDKIEEIEVKYPVSGVFGLGGGFKIPVQLIGTGVLETEIVSSFDSVGVNQTRLTINAVIKTEGKLLALGQGEKISIKSDVPVLMTVIVGNVPNTYVTVKK